MLAVVTDALSVVLTLHRSMQQLLVLLLSRICEQHYPETICARMMPQVSSTLLKLCTAPSLK
jgi:hypothetical protein